MRNSGAKPHHETAFLCRKLREHPHALERVGISAGRAATPGRASRCLGRFEANLETTLWALKGEQVKGTRPSTDKTSASDWINELGKTWPQFTPAAQEALRAASEAAFDLMEYRHAVMHGSMLPSPTMPTFIRNPRWNGEIRKRASHDAHVDANLLDMALDCAWVLCRLVFAAREACADPAKVKTIEALKRDVTRVRLNVSEVRHLTALMNSEKY
jgi:hypothetical protein